MRTAHSRTPITRIMRIDSSSFLETYTPSIYKHGAPSLFLRRAILSRCHGPPLVFGAATILGAAGETSETVTVTPPSLGLVAKYWAVLAN